MGFNFTAISREVERVRSYSRDSAVITNELTSLSPILMTLRAEKVVSSARAMWEVAPIQ